MAGLLSINVPEKWKTVAELTLSMRHIVPRTVHFVRTCTYIWAQNAHTQKWIAIKFGHQEDNLYFKQHFAFVLTGPWNTKKMSPTWKAWTFALASYCNRLCRSCRRKSDLILLLALFSALWLPDAVWVSANPNRWCTLLMMKKMTVVTIPYSAGAEHITNDRGLNKSGIDSLWHSWRHSQRLSAYVKAYLLDHSNVTQLWPISLEMTCTDFNLLLELMSNNTNNNKQQQYKKCLLAVNMAIYHCQHVKNLHTWYNDSLLTSHPSLSLLCKKAFYFDIFFHISTLYKTCWVFLEKGSWPGRESLSLGRMSLSEISSICRAVFWSHDAAAYATGPPM